MSELPISEARDRLGELVSRAELEAAEDEADLDAAREALAEPVRVPHCEMLAEYGIEIT
jgi:hypothetical protein